MADSCRPVSRHGRYNASGPSSVQYTSDVQGFENVDYTPSDEMYTVHQPTRPERPRTGHGRRSKADIPPRPGSRRRQVRRPDANEESYGRPVSRVGFSPEAEYRYSHDEYSRQISLEDEKQIQNSPNNSPEPQDIFTNNEQLIYQSGVLGTSPVQRDALRNSPVQRDVLRNSPVQRDALGNSPVQRDVLRESPQSGGKVDRLLVSPSSPSVRTFRQSPQGYRESPKGYRQSPQMYRQSSQGYGQSPHGYRQSGQSPQGYRQSGDSPQGYRQSPQGYHQQSPQYIRPSSRDNMNVSPIQRDEAQIMDSDLHHYQPSDHHGNGQMDFTDGDRYQQRFRESPSGYGASPMYQEAGSQYRGSPQYQENRQYSTSPSHTQNTHSRLLPSQRPKSARPKTGRKKSARMRHRHEEQETSQPQHCDTSSILNAGDPYGRPSSSLSPYKPLPGIGQATPRSAGSEETRADPLQGQVDSVTVGTQGLMLGNNGSQFLGNNESQFLGNNGSQFLGNNGSQFHPADNDYDTFTAEDIHGASSSGGQMFPGTEVPRVDELTNIPGNLSGEIYEKSVLNFERNMKEELDQRYAGNSDDGRFENSGNSEEGGLEGENRIRSSEPRHLSVLHDLPDEPTDSERRTLLAVKLPDGKRIQRQFRPSETLAMILHFAENASRTDFSEYLLVCNTPKLTFVDLSQCIGDTPIQDRTVLYLEEKD